MKEFWKRAFSAIIYVAVLLSAVFYDYNSTAILFGLFGLIGLWEFKKMVSFSLPVATVLYVLFALVALYGYPVSFVKAFIIGSTVSINFILIAFLYGSLQLDLKSNTGIVIALSYIGLNFIQIVFIPKALGPFDPWLLFGVFVIIWTNDTFAYLTGRLLGKTKLFPSVSPNKTIEGAIGGAVFALIATFVFSQFHQNLSLMQWIILATVTISFGTLGDLVESKFKRLAKVKDSGNILPGHGGILDRLDSLFFAAPFINTVLLLLH